MARTAYRSSLRYPVDQAYQIIAGILRSRRYNEYNYKGDFVWKEGIGMATAMHYIKISFPDANTLQVSGWIQAGLGSAGFSEHALSGVVGVIPKKQVQTVIAEILGNVSSDPAILANPAGFVNAYSKGCYPDLPPYIPGGPNMLPPTQTPNQIPAAAPAPVQSTEARSQFCPHCGNKMIIPAGHTNNFIFCQKCGTRSDIL